VRVTVVGAGAVGLNLAARLSAAGTPVRVVSRRPGALAGLTAEGIRLEDPATGRIEHAPVSATALLGAPFDARDGPVLVCVRGGETEAVAAGLALASPEAVVASAQNDVDNESILAGRFARVLGLVVRQTSTLRGPRHVLATGRGRLVVGRHPAGLGPDVAALADRLEAAGFDVGRSPRIDRDKWLKLCINGTSAVNALVRRADHTGEAFVTLKIRLLEEAAAALRAAGIEARSCDGRDRSIEQEIDFLRASLAEGSSLRALPLYNACWTALHDPERPLESDAHHRRILDLAVRHGTAAPTHAAVLVAVTEARTRRTGPESIPAEALLARARGADGG
jgi:2-dehydropantoate 2-reductase